MKYSKIALIGMMGCGKSTIGKLLSDCLNFDFYDTDSIFEIQNNISISDFFNQYSESEFRIQESQILKDLIKNDNIVISCGGGIILSEDNRKILFSDDILTIFLSAESETIYNRLKNNTSRPLLQVDNPELKIKEILQDRMKYYNMAKATVITDNKTKDQIIEGIKWILLK